MIPLRIKVETEFQGEPYVARLRITQNKRCSEVVPFVSEEDAVLIDADKGSAEFSSRYGRFVLLDIDPAKIDGDVVFIVPTKGVAHRWIRAGSRHNTLLVTERCDQYCLMCSQPPKNQHTDFFPFFQEAARLAPRGAIIGLSGGEPTLFKNEMLTFLERVLSDRPDIGFHILTNAQHFHDGDIDRLRALPRKNILWGVPLYSSSSAEHDSIVCKPGAQEKLLESLSILARSGSAIELRTVVMRPNVHNLPTLSEFIVTHLPFIDVWALMQLENIGFGRMRWRELFFDSSLSFSPIAQAVDSARAFGIEISLYNFPLCTVPKAYRSLAPATISDWKNKFLDECSGCSARESCSGFFEWYPVSAGFAGVGAI